MLTQTLARLRLANLPVGRQVLFCSSFPNQVEDRLKFIPVAMATACTQLDWVKRNFSSNKTKFGCVSLTQHWVSKSKISLLCSKDAANERAMRCMYSKCSPDSLSVPNSCKNTCISLCFLLTLKHKAL